MVQVVVGEVVAGGRDAGVGGCCYGHRNFSRGCCREYKGLLDLELWLLLSLFDGDDGLRCTIPRVGDGEGLGPRRKLWRGVMRWMDGLSDVWTSSAGRAGLVDVGEPRRLVSVWWITPM